jgi:hypothetical protein
MIRRFGVKVSVRANQIRARVFQAVEKLLNRTEFVTTNLRVPDWLRRVQSGQKRLGLFGKKSRLLLVHVRDDQNVSDVERLQLKHRFACRPEQAFELIYFAHADNFPTRTGRTQLQF